MWTPQGGYAVPAHVSCPSGTCLFNAEVIHTAVNTMNIPQIERVDFCYTVEEVSVPRRTPVSSSTSSVM
jgi:hypothetical protein